MVKEFIVHLRPKKIWYEASKFSTTFGLGGLLSLMFLILTFTGIILMFFYIPYPSNAYISLKKIINIVPFGRIIRNIHRLCGDLMIIFSFFHMLRIIKADAFDNKHRILNWVTGAMLFFLLFPFNFTGYLLPWDSLSYWGATIVLNLLDSIPFIGKNIKILISGGETINEITLIRFYTLHIVVLPLIFSILLMNHFYLIRLAGGVKVKKKEQKVLIKDLYEKEIIYALIFSIIIFLLCFKFYNAPLLDNANSNIIPEIIKAPWYFASIQYLLTYFPEILAGVIIPFLFFLFITFFYKIRNIYIFISVNFLFLIMTIIEKI